MAVQKEQHAAADLLADGPLKGKEVFPGHELPEFFVRFPARLVNRDSVDVLQRDALVQDVRIPVALEDQAAIGKDDLPVIQKVAKILEPVGVSVDVPDLR